MNSVATEKLEKLTLDGIGKTPKEATKALVGNMRDYRAVSKQKLPKPISKKYEISCICNDKEPEQVSGRYASLDSFGDAEKIARRGFRGTFTINEYIVSCTYEVPKAVVDSQAKKTGKPAGRLEESCSLDDDRIYHV